MGFLAAYIMRGKMQAMLVASTSAALSLLLPPFCIVSSGTVALVTLRRGATEGFLILLSAIAALMGITLMSSLDLSLLYGLLFWLPVWLIAVVLREGRQLSLALESMILLGVLVIVSFYLLTNSPSQTLQGYFEQKAQLIAQSTPEIQFAKLQQTVALFAPILTGILASVLVYVMLFGLFLGRWWQSILYNPGGFRDEYLNLRVNRKLAWASLVILMTMLSGYGIYAELAANIWVLLFILYTVVGTAALHAIINGLKNQQSKRFLIPMLYLTLTLIPQTTLIVAITGLTDAWLDLRNKKSNQNSA